MEPITVLIVFGVTVIVGSFIGSSITRTVFPDNKNIESEIKSEIHVMSSDIKGHSIYEIVLIGCVTFIFAAFIGAAVVYFVMKKKEKKSKTVEISLQDISIAHADN